MRAFHAALPKLPAALLFFNGLCPSTSSQGVYRPSGGLRPSASPSRQPVERPRRCDGRACAAAPGRHLLFAAPASSAVAPTTATKWARTATVRTLVFGGGHGGARVDGCSVQGGQHGGGQRAVLREHVLPPLEERAGRSPRRSTTRGRRQRRRRRAAARQSSGGGGGARPQLGGGLRRVAQAGPTRGERVAARRRQPRRRRTPPAASAPPPTRGSGRRERGMRGGEFWERAAAAGSGTRGAAHWAAVAAGRVWGARRARARRARLARLLDERAGGGGGGGAGGAARRAAARGGRRARLRGGDRRGAAGAPRPPSSSPRRGGARRARAPRHPWAQRRSRRRARYAVIWVHGRSTLTDDDVAAFPAAPPRWSWRRRVVRRACARARLLRRHALRESSGGRASLPPRRGSPAAAGGVPVRCGRCGRDRGSQTRSRPRGPAGEGPAML